jgi:hypothetical protein
LKMYVTDILLGKPYQSYVPRPVAPGISASFRRDFEALDRAILANPVDGQGAALSAVLQYDDEPTKPESRTCGVEQALARFSGRVRFGVRDLEDANALLTQRKGEGFRRRPVWIGASHPGSSTHVGSPPGRLAALSREILSLRDQAGPVSLWAIIAMVRLLQVHPFADGNGRTARLYACWAVQHGLVGGDLFPGIIRELWIRSSFCLSSACIAIRDHEDWTPLLERCLEASARTATVRSDGGPDRLSPRYPISESARPFALAKAFPFTIEDEARESLS